MSRHERGPNATVARSARSALAITAGLASLALVPSSALAQSSLAPLRGAGQPGAIAGKYIVVMKNGKGAVAADRVERRARGRGGRVARQYRRVLTGFTATLSDAALTEVRNDPDVAYVERDTIVSLDATQSNATWGLDRIDQTSLPLNGTYTYTPTGAGVTAYIIDTGIRTSHQQFGGRASSGFDAIDGGSADDCNGHGTHVAGTVGGSTYGVAKGVSLKAVRVLDCNGSGATSGVIAGIDWVTGNHAAGAPAVANMSLGGGASSAMDQAVNNSIADGVTYAVAAGNSNTNACNSSPARAAAALTVASTTSSDARSSFSNYGSCVDLFAPGSSITSSWSSSDSATNTISGTSMATPHVAGTAALHLQGATSASPASVSSAILSATTPNKVSDAKSGTPNKLLYTLFGAAPPPPPPPPPAPPPAPPPPPPPPPPPSGCSLAESYSRSLGFKGDYDYQPNGSSYTSAKSGIHRGCLRGPSNADFDLALYKRNSSGSWVRVAISESPTSTEDIAYSGTSGTYRWKLYSFSGSGTYVFGMTRV